MTISQISCLMILCLFQLLHQLSIRPTWGCLAALVMVSPYSEKYLGDLCVKAFQFGVKGCYQFKYLLDSHSKIVPSWIWSICSCNQVVTRLSFSVTSLISGCTCCRRTPVFSLQLTGLHHGGPLSSSSPVFFSSLSSFSCWFFPLLLFFLFDWIKTGMPTRAFRLASLRASSFKNASPTKKKIQLRNLLGEIAPEQVLCLTTQVFMEHMHLGLGFRQDPQDPERGHGWGGGLALHTDGEVGMGKWKQWLLPTWPSWVVGVEVLEEAGTDQREVGRQPLCNQVVTRLSLDP